MMPLSEPWLILAISSNFSHPLKWWSLEDWGSCPFGNLQACLHVSFHLSLPVIRSLFRSHHLLSSNHWRKESRGEKKGSTWCHLGVCVSSGGLVGPRAESPPQTPSCVWKQLLPSPPGVSLTQTKVPWTDLTTCYCSRSASATGMLVHQIFHSISFS